MSHKTTTMKQGTTLSIQLKNYVRENENNEAIKSVENLMRKKIANIILKSCIRFRTS